MKSRLPQWFKLSTVPIGFWMLIGLTYVWRGDPLALWLMREAAWPLAIFGTAYIVIVLCLLQLRKDRHAK